jgi:hypothetical protein
MSAALLQNELAAAGVRLSIDGDGLAYDAPRGAMTPDLLVRMRTHKRELMAHLRAAMQASDKPVQMPEAWFQPGALAPRREHFAFDPETSTHPGWWDLIYELHNRNLTIVNGKVAPQTNA